MYRFVPITLAAALAAPAAQAQFPPPSPGAIMPGQLSTSSLAAIAQQQGIDGRFPGAPPLIRRPFPVAFPIYGYGWGYGYAPQPPVIVIREVVREVPVPVTASNRLGRPLTAPPAAAGPVDPDRAVLTLKVPDGAEVWIEGRKMEGQTGPERTFTTPVLGRGATYAYRVRVTWGDSGEWERDISFSAGERKSVLVLGR